MAAINDLFQTAESALASRGKQIVHIVHVDYEVEYVASTSELALKYVAESVDAKSAVAITAIEVDG